MDFAAWSMTATFCTLLLLGLFVRVALASRQIRFVMRHRGAVPPAFADTVSLAAHQKAADYTVANSRLGLMDMFFGAALLLVWTLLGGLDWLNALAVNFVFGDN